MGVAASDGGLGQPVGPLIPARKRVERYHQPGRHQLGVERPGLLGDLDTAARGAGFEQGCGYNWVSG